MTSEHRQLANELIEAYREEVYLEGVLNDRREEFFQATDDEQEARYRRMGLEEEYLGALREAAVSS